ncbi:hypothetical protein MY10362_002365 [Beauveria mimosiformis]
MQFKALLALALAIALAALCHSDADCPQGQHCKQQGEFPNIKVCK